MGVLEYNKPTHKIINHYLINFLPTNLDSWHPLAPHSKHFPYIPHEHFNLDYRLIMSTLLTSRISNHAFLWILSFTALFQLFSG